MTNNPYLTLTFFTRKPRSEGYTDHKVYVRISVAGQQTDLAIGRSVNPENWDQKRKLSKGRSRRDLELNKYLDEIRARFCEIHTNLVREKKLVNPIVMRDLFLGKVEKPKMLCEIFTESNAKRKEEMERGDMVNATYLRWERCVTYLGEFMRLTMNVDDIPVTCKDLRVLLCNSRRLFPYASLPILPLCRDAYQAMRPEIRHLPLLLMLLMASLSGCCQTLLL